LLDNYTIRISTSGPEYLFHFHNLFGRIAFHAGRSIFIAGLVVFEYLVINLFGRGSIVNNALLANTHFSKESGKPKA